MSNLQNPEAICTLAIIAKSNIGESSLQLYCSS